jgi:outer membrane protein assembly factor BamB
MTAKIVFFALATLATLAAGAKTLAPKEVAPVTKDGTVYSAPSDQMGCVVATNEQTGKVSWFRQVYVVKYQVKVETDIQDCFITDLKVEGRKCLVTNAEGGQFEINLNDLSVKVIKGRALIDRTKEAHQSSAFGGKRGRLAPPTKK